MINTPFGSARFLGTVGVSLREDASGIFDVLTGEYYVYWGQK